MSISDEGSITRVHFARKKETLLRLYHNHSAYLIFAERQQQKIGHDTIPHMKLRLATRISPTVFCEESWHGLLFWFLLIFLNAKMFTIYQSTLAKTNADLLGMYT
jgi:hypothetical protein